MIEKTTLSNCREGNILASDVLNDSGVILAAKDTVLNKYIIDHLIALRIKSVDIYKAISCNNNCASDEKFLNNYIGSIIQTKRVFQDLVSGKPLDYHSVLSITEHIHSNINENTRIISCLTDIRGTDEYTYTHSVNVAFYSMLIAKWLNLSENEITKAIQAGLLHDVGKSRVPNEILNKKGVLTKEEFEVIKQHTVLGYEIVDIDGIDSDIKKAVLLHHERMDGSGYPYSYDSNCINLYSKIVAVADVFDAMTTDRVYKKRSTPFESFEMFQTVGLSMFDTKILNTFLNNLAAYLVGSNVLLSNGETGEIVFVPLQCITSPIVKSSSGYMDLSIENTVRVLNMI